MVRSLADAGRSDVVYRIIDRTDPPGYGCMLRTYNLKTLSEQWDKPGSSLNHCMFGHIQEWFQAYLLGIRQADGSVGFARLHLAPTPVGNLNEAQGYYDSPKGRVAVHWKKTSETFTLEVTVAANVTADVVLPVPANAAITESGKPVTENPGVSGVQKRDGHPVVSVGPGSYKFVCGKS
jgi:alpha-L-rhamnosidase